MQTHVDFNAAENMVVVKRMEDVQPLLDRNKNLQNNEQYKRDGIKNGWWHAASIPPSVIEQWMKEGISIFRTEDWPKIKAKLNDPEWAYLRTGLGKL